MTCVGNLKFLLTSYKTSSSPTLRLVSTARSSTSTKVSPPRWTTREEEEEEEEVLDMRMKGGEACTYLRNKN